MTGFEPLIVAATAGLTALITDVIKSKGGKLLDQFDVKLPRLRQASQQYLQKYIDRHGTLKIVCVRMDSPVKLDEVYTAVQLLERSEVRYFESADALQDLFRQTGKRGFAFRELTKQDGVAVANQHQYLMVLGSPGAGKSTFLRKVGLETLKGNKGAFRHPSIPVFLMLRQFDNSKSIEQLIAEEFATCGFEQAPELTQAFLEKGKLLILLDGLDEVPTEQVDAAITQIQNLVDRYPQNRFIASCRIAAYKGGFTRFKDVTVANFEDAQIQEFIHHWFQAEPETANQCWQLLERPEYAAAKELAQTPLLLTLLCAVYDEAQNFPKNRSTLYGEALDVLLKKWAAEKRIYHDPIYRELSIELERELLAEIAYDSFVSDRLFFSRSEVVNQIREFLINNLNAPKHLDGEAVLEAIEIQQGILVERARNAYSFSHLTLQEYLTAKHIVDNNQIEQLVTEHLTDENWREVFLLVAGLVPGRSGADALLLAMEQKARTHINSLNLVSLLHWADQATAGAKSNYKAAARRAVAIALAFCFLDFDCASQIALARDFAIATSCVLDSNFILAHDLAQNLDCTCVPVLDQKFAHTLRQAGEIFTSVNFSELIYKLQAFQSRALKSTQPHRMDQSLCGKVSQLLWLDTFQLDPELVELSDEEVEAAEQYFYTTELIVRCKEAAVRVSPQTWEAIESRMVKV
jgi:metal-responsive CopG/Arc/MetJ family transcriptional regulator